MNNEINPTPANDFPLGPIGANSIDTNSIDTEGHLWRREPGTGENEQSDEVALEATDDDTEGHGLRR